jgi:hypothetical protein
MQDQDITSFRFCSKQKLHNFTADNKVFIKIKNVKAIYY